jgi:hypothetical protein
MTSTPAVIAVHVFAAPSTLLRCRLTWEGATGYLRERLRQRFGEP